MWHEIFLVYLMAFGVNCVDSKTPLTKCCKNNQLYMTELDLCREIKGNRRGNQSQSIQAPPIHVIGREAGRILVEDQSFKIEYQLHSCPKGKVGYSSDEFMFYEDGSINSQGEGSTYNQGEFCIHESFSTGRLVARYCVDDPCYKADVCIRKCCPYQMAFNSSSKTCSVYTTPLNVTIYNQNGTALTKHDAIERDGVAPKCPSGYVIELRQQSCYRQQIRGWLYLFNNPQCSSSPDEETITDNYCIDHFVDKNNTEWKQYAWICVKKESRRWSGIPIFMVISAFFLVATFAVYALIPEIRNIHGVVIMCYVGSRAATELTFGVLHMTSNKPPAVCRAMSILIHFSYISTYTWLNVVCFDIWWTLRSMQVNSCINQATRQNQLGKQFIAYSSYSWGVAGIIVTIGQLLDYFKDKLPSYIIRPGFGEKSCWFSGYESMFAYVYGPVCFLILSDVFFFVKTTILIRRAGIGSSNRHSREKYRLRVIFSLFVVKVASWVTELVAYGTGSINGAAYPIVVVETIASILTFVIFVCKASVWQLCKKKCPCLERVEFALLCFKQPQSRPYSSNATNSTMVSSRELLHSELSVSLSRTRKDAVNIPL